MILTLRLALEKNGEGAEPILRVETFVNSYFKEPFDGGFNIDWVKDAMMSK